ncbi:gluconolactonase [Advenella kashmirensis W13003]|uniref:Gluconolactonase n=1 Tax=Advenella kashmirensis W13003 TaxID=1424334 RepID=V8QNJ1_9BURK|nr:SMP-30/gluconolactonase/LRE family protein [Advenella kashmirensis]ETF01516.1 gluconolactonase [Advenella kashmirensis W13003]
MFYTNQPEVRSLEHFSILPEQYREQHQTAWADANQGGRKIDSFLEGPVFDDKGNLYVADIPYGRIFRIDPKGNWDLVVQWDGEPNGMKFAAANNLLVTDYKNGLMQVDVHSGVVKPFFSRRHSERFKGVNDLTISSQGDIYFTDQGQTGLHDPTGRVYRLSKTGRLDLLLSNVPSPNGIVLSEDGKVLYVAVTRGNCVWRMPIQEDGSVSKAGQFFTSYGPSGPDGLALDKQGRLLVANPGLAYVWVLNPRAEPVQVLRGPPGHSLTNLAFGGSDGKTLYVTDSTAGDILTVQMDAPGLRLHQLD